LDGTEERCFPFSLERDEIWQAIADTFSKSYFFFLLLVNLNLKVVQLCSNTKQKMEACKHSSN